MPDTFSDIDSSSDITSTLAPSNESGDASASMKTTGELLRPYLIGILITILAIVSLLIYQNRRIQIGGAATYVALQLELKAERLAKAAQLALRGTTEAFDEVQQTERLLTADLEKLINGGSQLNTTIPPAKGEVLDKLSKFKTTWESSSEGAKRLVEMRQNLVDLKKSVESIDTESPNLLEESERLLNTGKINISNVRDFNPGRLMMLTQRLPKNANSILASESIDPDVALTLGRDAITLQEVAYQISQITADGDLRTIRDRFMSYAQVTIDESNSIVNNIQPLVEAKTVAFGLLQEASNLGKNAEEISQYIIKFYAWQIWEIAAIAILSILTILISWLMFQAYAKDAAKRQAEAELNREMAESEKNMTQQAILRLMNEMGDLADGDLTIRTTVSEDITGAIADSVNYTVEELAILVRRINDAASRVAASSQTAQNTSQELIEASTRQSMQLKLAGKTVDEMAEAITKTSNHALASAQVARQGLLAAQKGQESVQNTIRGMNEIREKIQETSKRIKRLGESSQEIGEIVDLISDITEQTNVLALNAAIQAASAGAAGRGFTVVAEEVQRLAERSAEATKQIGAIVKTIQTDTQDAVGAMEFATRDVVEGAQLSDSAGQALSEISQISLETARLIEEISKESGVQAKSATQIAGAMREILAITEQTTTGTQKTAASVGELADLAVELKGSVSGFKV